MPPSRRRSNSSSLFESSTIITANLIMASSSYLLSRIKPRRAPAAAQPATPVMPKVASAMAPPTAWSSSAAARARSAVEPMAGNRTVFMQPDDEQDGKVDQDADMFIKRFRERTQSEADRYEAGAPPVWPPVAAAKSAGTVHRYPL